MLIQSKYSASARTEMIRFITGRPKRSLEIGCREGLFTRRLGEIFKGLEGWGVEPDKTTLEEAGNHLFRVFEGRFPDPSMELPGEYFDLIVFNDVLEHMYDPWKALEACHGLLAPKGIVVASIPNIRHRPILRDLILHDRFEYQDSGNMDISHIRFFTKTGMRELFERTGFRIRRLEPVQPLRNPFKRLWSRLTFGWMESFYVPQYGVAAESRRTTSPAG